MPPLWGPQRLADTMPAAEATTPTAGTGQAASRDDHIHPRLASATRVTLNASSTATVTFTRSFVSAPVIQLCAINPSGAQVVLEVVADIKTGAVWTGCTIKGSRARQLPVIDAVGGLLTAVITGVNNIATALTGYDIFAASASGVVVNVLAIEASA